ncbi:P-type ATPase [Trinorchestia longiramus]|nr:P-type ATPase [Trinorchestia longiramus]
MSLPAADDARASGQHEEVLVNIADLPPEAPTTVERIMSAPSEEAVAIHVTKEDEPKTKRKRQPAPTFMETPFQIPLEVGVLRVLAFSSDVQRMSVVVRRLGAPSMELFAKGAPEVIFRLSEPDTVPGNLSGVLESYTVKGYRVLAVAHRLLPQRLTWKAAQKAPGEKVDDGIVYLQLEQKLTFLGLLVLQNPLKTASSAAIAELVHADIRTVMATGDNVLTGVSVARECSMVPPNAPVVLLNVTPPSGGDQPSPPVLSASLLQQDTPLSSVVTVTAEEDTMEFLQRYHLGISGSSWKLLCLHFPQYVDAVCCRGTVFGRMSPDQKTQLVEALMGLDYVVSMCGDGANDCGALKAAHVGISLSEAEASVAAPFTSNVADVSCAAAHQGRQGGTCDQLRGVQVHGPVQHHPFHTNLSDPQFLYIDLGIVTSLALFMGYSAASQSLVRERPSGSLLSPVTLFSVLLQVLAVIAGQVAAYYYLAAQPWFVPKESDGKGGAGAGDIS